MLNDVWYNIHKNVYFLTRSSFNQAPPVPGVYAWYYPLRVSTFELDEFMNEVLSVMAYDSKSGGDMTLEQTMNTAWRSYGVRIKQYSGVDSIPKAFLRTWERQRNQDFEKLRADLMRLSLFLPPLYVGKTVNLSRRIREHIDGRTGAPGFHQRFEEFACQRKLSQQTVSDLLCVAITSPEEVASNDYVELIEYIMKSFSAPGFSVQ